MDTNGSQGSAVQATDDDGKSTNSSSHPSINTSLAPCYSQKLSSLQSLDSCNKSNPDNSKTGTMESWSRWADSSNVDKKVQNTSRKDHHHSHSVSVQISASAQLLKSLAEETTPKKPFFPQWSELLESSKSKIRNSLSGPDGSRSSSMSSLPSIEEPSSDDHVRPPLDLKTQESNRYFTSFRVSSLANTNVNNIHSCYAEPKDYVFCMKHEALPVELQLAICSDHLSSYVDQEGHCLKPVYLLSNLSLYDIRSDLQALGINEDIRWPWKAFSHSRENSSRVKLDGRRGSFVDTNAIHPIIDAILPYLPKTLPVGICAVCSKDVHAPCILGHATWSLSGALERCTPLSTPSTAFVCQGCHLIAHQSCAEKLFRYCPRTFNAKKVQEAFFRIWTSLLRDYRSFLDLEDTIPSATPSKTHPVIALKKFVRGGSNSLFGRDRPAVRKDSCPVFKKHAYLEQLPDKETRMFMNCLCDTQAFHQFAYDRVERKATDYEVLFFDEAIKAKLNRSKIKISKEATPFLQVRN